MRARRLWAGIDWPKARLALRASEPWPRLDSGWCLVIVVDVVVVVAVVWTWTHGLLKV